MRIRGTQNNAAAVSYMTFRGTIYKENALYPHAARGVNIYKKKLYFREHDRLAVGDIVKANKSALERQLCSMRRIQIKFSVLKFISIQIPPMFYRWNFNSHVYKTYPVV